MTEVLGDFIRALRAADIRVSTSESIDAGNVVDLVGLGEREILRQTCYPIAQTEPNKAGRRRRFRRLEQN